MNKFCLILILFAFGSLVFSQTTESGRLLQQAFETVYSNPEEALKVAQHIIKSPENNHQKAEAFLLSSQAHYAKGNYDQSLSDAFEARNLSVGKKGEKTFEQSTFIISEILHFLQLNSEADKLLAEISGEIKSHKNSSEINSLISTGDNFFQEKKNDSSILVFQNALLIAKKLNNPFLQQEIHQKLSANFLSLDNKKEYHAHNQEAVALRNVTTRMENNASNTAHQLINQEKDNELLKTKNQFSTSLWIVLSVTVLLILIKIILVIRNHNKLKTYSTLLNYLNKEKPKEKEVPAVEEITNEMPRTTTILKESENQILQGLLKFESSKRFTSKEMSLGMLAVQLNTNTKYLSEIINRHKEKNFNSYINELRINYITEKIKTEPNYLNYKVSYLAEECGFASHSTFTTVFKSVVGVSPITFVEFVRKEISTEKEILV
ncbi:helix-turn-helix domain-containing protein [Moheibacter sediminis]|uniref:Helix-turn-helix domain-containing protein n=1 Tax=Moheibacter sediminis TaxID=1434700 RepID=A0A1W1Y803_9FLAO|nr:helix-turn-helix domain-containing protein [Moheibacter sediminis]SMC32279.1 Helix-turn-helix domain-containing protein [Moheibacter sediminis]